MKKLKGVRPLEQINQEYSIQCAQLGNLSFRVHELQKEMGKINKRLEEIDLEAAECRKQMGDQVEKVAEAVADDAGLSVAPAPEAQPEATA